MSLFIYEFSLPSYTFGNNYKRVKTLIFYDGGNMLLISVQSVIHSAILEINWIRCVEGDDNLIIV